jgi:hypothetical protein
VDLRLSRVQRDVEQRGGQLQEEAEDGLHPLARLGRAFWSRFDETVSDKNLRTKSYDQK